MITEKLRKEGVQLHWSLGEGSFVNRGFFPGVDKLVAPINVAEKGIMNLMIVAKAKGGHSSTPPKRTAVTILAEALVKLEREPLPGSLEGLSAAMFDEVSKHMPFGYRFLFANRWLFGGMIDCTNVINTSYQCDDQNNNCTYNVEWEYKKQCAADRGLSINQF